MIEFCQSCGYSRDLHRTPGAHAFVSDNSDEITAPEPKPSDLEQEIRRVLNKHSAENGSNTPDFILAGYLMACLKAYNEATIKAREWQGVGYLNVGAKDV
jgi:hypothetical protein